MCNFECDATASEKTPEKSDSAEGLFKFLDNRINDQKNNVNVTSDAIILTRQYLEKPNLARNLDPLQFWNTYDSEPVRKLAHKFLSVPPTSVPSERIFSKTGSIISERRTRLKPEIVHKLTFIQQNKWLLD